MAPNAPFTVFLTGAAQGIGCHLAHAFYQRGWQVVATDRDLPALQAATAGWDAARGLAFALDVTDARAWEAAVAAAQERFGPVEVFVNNAGVVAPGFATELAVDGRHTGHLINIASLAGVAPIHGLPVYSATKYAVRGFTLAVAYELAQHGVHVSVICPDLVHTNMLQLQLDYPAAALSFSGPAALAVHDVERAVFFNALGRRQVEILLPAGRGWLARFGNLWPRLGRLLTSRLVAKGQRAQQAYRVAAKGATLS